MRKPTVQKFLEESTLDTLWLAKGCASTLGILRGGERHATLLFHYPATQQNRGDASDQCR